MAAPGIERPRSPALLPLQDGEHLSRAEFERRYEAMPELKKAELIEGVVQMPSPVRFQQHGRPHGRLYYWLATYELATSGCASALAASVRLDLTNEPQPDALLFIQPDHGGSVQISADDYIERAPELVAEVSASTLQFDLDAKFQAYERNQVREYLVWKVAERQIDWFVNRVTGFEPLTRDANGILRSEAFPGLWLDPVALAEKDDMPRVLQVLQQGLATPEHDVFIERLRQASQPSR